MDDFSRLELEAADQLGWVQFIAPIAEVGIGLLKKKKAKKAAKKAQKEEEKQARAEAAAEAARTAPGASPLQAGFGGVSWPMLALVGVGVGAAIYFSTRRRRR